MAASFSELGIGDALASVAAAQYDRPTPLQAAAAPVIRRGGNVVLHASSGAGVTAAFAVPVLDRLGSAEGGTEHPRALVVTPTQERAAGIARAVSRFAAAAGIAVRAGAPGWRAAGADVLVLSAARALEAVQASELKLEDITSFIVADAGELFALGGGPTLETLVALIPRDAQRIIASANLDGDVQAFIEAHVRKALTLPARPAAPERGTQAPESLGQIAYMLVEARAKDDTLARLLETVEGDAVVRARTRARAARVGAELAARGMAGIDVVAFDEDGRTAERVISYDVPFTVEQLRAFHAGGGTVLVTPAERAHFRRIAAEAPFTVKLRRARSQDAGEVDQFRAAVRNALLSEDLAAQLLVLEPLLDEAAPAEVAAALSALLRRRAVPQTTAPATQAAAGPAPAQASAGGFTRLFVSVGARDNIRPGDIVGAITGEANIKGDQVGRVDIRESFSVVEVASPVAERVIRALNGTTMRGRSLRVDFDRKNVSGAGRERGGPPQRGPRDRSGPPRRRPPAR